MADNENINIIPFPGQIIGKRSKNVVPLGVNTNNVIRSPRILRDATSFTLIDEDQSSAVVRFFREHTSSAKPPEDNKS